MRIHTRLDYEWTEDGSLRLVHEEGFDYDGLVAQCKGDEVARQTELLQQQNAAVQMGFNQQLMTLFQAQFGKQSGVLDYLKGKMQPMIDNPTGYSPEALAAMRTSVTDTLSTNYQNAQRALQARQFAQGSRDLPSGVNEQLNAALVQSEASDKAAAQNNLTVQNEGVKQANYWNAINELNGVGASFDPLGYAGAATNSANAASNAGNSVANLSQAVTASNQSGLMGALGGLAGGVFGAAGQAGGFGKLFCWIAAAHFNGWEDSRTQLVRAYLIEDFSQHWYAAPVLWLYAKTGRWVAKQRILVWALGPLFDLALRKAEEGK